MIVDQLPNLAQFFGAYFHQDWDLEADDALGVIRNYLKEANFPSTQQTIKEIEQLIKMNLSEEQLRDIIVCDMSCNYDPSRYGISYLEWLYWVQTTLKQGTYQIVEASA